MNREKTGISIYSICGNFMEEQSEGRTILPQIPQKSLSPNPTVPLYHQPDYILQRNKSATSGGRRSESFHAHLLGRKVQSELDDYDTILSPRNNLMEHGENWVDQYSISDWLHNTESKVDQPVLDFGNRNGVSEFKSGILPALGTANKVTFEQRPISRKCNSSKLEPAFANTELYEDQVCTNNVVNQPFNSPVNLPVLLPVNVPVNVPVILSDSVSHERLNDDNEHREDCTPRSNVQEIEYLMKEAKEIAANIENRISLRQRKSPRTEHPLIYRDDTLNLLTDKQETRLTPHLLTPHGISIEGYGRTVHSEPSDQLSNKKANRQLAASYSDKENIAEVTQSEADVMQQTLKEVTQSKDEVYHDNRKNKMSLKFTDAELNKEKLNDGTDDDENDDDVDMMIEGTSLTLPPFKEESKARRNNKINNIKTTTTKSSVHYFCTVSAHDIQMSPHHGRIWQEYQQNRNHDRRFLTAPFVDMESKADGEYIDSVTLAAEKIMKDLEIMISSNDSNSTQISKVKKGNSIIPELSSSVTFWLPAPPKWNIRPEEVKKILFPEYHGTHVTGGVMMEEEMEVESFWNDEENLERERRENLSRTLSRRYRSFDDIYDSIDKVDEHMTDDTTVDGLDMISESLYDFVRIRQQSMLNKNKDFTLFRSLSAPASLTLDDDMLLIYEDFQSTLKEIQIQKNEFRVLSSRYDNTSRVMSYDNLEDTTERSASLTCLSSRAETKIERAIRLRDLKSASKVINVEVESGHLVFDKKIKKRNNNNTKVSTKRSRRRRKFSRVDDVMNFLLSDNRSFSNLTRTESCPHRLDSYKRYKIKVPQLIKYKRQSSVPDILDFESYKLSNRSSEYKDSSDKDLSNAIWREWNEERVLNKQSETNKHNINIEIYENADDIVEQSSLSNRITVTPLINESLMTESEKLMLEKEVELLTEEMNDISTPATAYDYCRRGAILRKLGRIYEALEDLNVSLTLESSLTDAYWHCHLVFIILDRKEEALADLAEILRLDPQNNAARKSRASLLALSNDLASALLELDEVLEKNPQDFEALLKRAQMYEELGHTHLALKDYTRCYELDKTALTPILKLGIHLFNIGHYGESVYKFTEIIDQDLRHCEARSMRALAYMKLKLWDAALTDLSTVIHLDPSNAEAFYYRGCLLTRSNSKQAIQDLSIALMLNSSTTNEYAYLQRGIAYYYMHKYVDAVVDFQAALKIDFNLISAIFNIGLISLKHLNHPRKAIEMFTKVLKQVPTQLKVYMCRAEAYERLGQLKLALRDITKAIHLQPDLMHLYHWRGNLVKKMGDLDLAKTCVRHLAEFGAERETDPLQQAIILSFLKNHTQAIEILENAQMNEPDLKVLNLLGKIYIIFEKWLEAVSTLNKALNAIENKRSKEASDIYFQIGSCYMEMEEHDEAIKAFTKVINGNKKKAMAYYWRGVLKLKQSNDRGILDINKSLSLDPSLYQAYLTRVAHFGSHGQYSKAILNCNEAIKLRPDCVRGYLYRGTLKFHMKSYALVLLDLNKAIEVEPECQIAYFNRAVCYHFIEKSREALRDYSIALVLGTRYNAQILTNRALLYMKLNDYENAVCDLQQVLDLIPNSLPIYHTLGLCYQKLNMLQDAIRSYTCAIELDPTSLDALIGRGNAFMDCSSHVAYEYAWQDFQTALDLSPGCISARVNLALCLQTMGKYMKAWDQFTVALNFDKKSTAALEGRAVVNLQMEDTFAAMQDINAAIKTIQTAELYTNRGVIHQFMNDNVNAMRDYQKAIQLDSTYSLAYLNAANLYFLQYHFNQALQYYNLCLEYEPNDESALINRAIVKTMMHDTAGALVDFERAISLSPFSSHIYFNRANLFLSLERHLEAEQDLNTALLIQPDDVLMLLKRSEVRGLLGKKEESLTDYKRVFEIQSVKVA